MSNDINDLQYNSAKDECIAMDSKSFNATIIYMTYLALDPYPFIHTYHLLNGAFQIEKKTWVQG